MRIAVISKDDLRGGGASFVAEKLSQFYKTLGHEADHYNLRSKEHKIYGQFDSILKTIKKIDGRLGYRDHRAFELLLGNIRKISREYDAIHLHDLSTVMSHNSVRYLAKRVPTVWTLHDCSPFTAGCLYPTECANFETVCHDCPRVRDWPIGSKFDRTTILHKKRKRVDGSGVKFVAPSHWMKDQYLRAGWEQNNISVIQNGVDISIYYPRDKKALRTKFGLKPDNLCLLFSSGWLHDARKGAADVAKLIRQLRDIHPTLLLVGRWSNEAAQIFSGLNIKHFGFVMDENQKADIISMADATLMFSQQENAPLTALESLACGTPVFGYGAGGISEVVENYKTGFVSSSFLVIEVTKSIYETKLGENLEMGRNAAKYAIDYHDYKLIANRYIEKFHDSKDTLAQNKQSKTEN